MNKDLQNSNEKAVPSAFFLILLSFLQKEYDFDTKNFLAKNKLSYSMLFDPSVTIKLTVLKNLISSVLEQQKDYTFLYKMAKLTSASKLGVLGYIMLHSQTLYDALQKLCTYYVLIGKRIKPVFAKQEKFYKLVIHTNDENGNFFDMEEYSILVHLFALVHLINEIIPFEIKPSFFHLKQKQTKFTIENNEIVGIKTYFSQEENAIFFDSSIEKMKTSLADEKLLKIFEKEAQDILGLSLSSSFFKEKISSLILLSSSELDISLESVAKRAGLSPRVLQKRLKEEGTSFSNLLMEVRKKLSIYYLSKDMDLNTISINLGYIDLSSFFRAFKKWYNKTPSQYKKDLKN